MQKQIHVVADTWLEEQVLRDVINVHWPFVGIKVGIYDGVFYPCGSFIVTESQLAMVEAEIERRKKLAKPQVEQIVRIAGGGILGIVKN